MRPRLSSVPLILVFRCHPQVKYTPGCGGRRRRRTGWRCRMRATTWTAGGGRRTRRARTAAPVATSTVGFPHDVLSCRRPRPPPAPGGRARRCPRRGQGGVLGGMMTSARRRVRRHTGCMRSGMQVRGLDGNELADHALGGRVVDPFANARARGCVQS